MDDSSACYMQAVYFLPAKTYCLGPCCICDCSFDMGLLRICVHNQPVRYVECLISIIIIIAFYIQGLFPGISNSPALSGFMVVLFLVVAHVIFCLQVTSYIRTIFTRHKVIPQQFFLTENQLEELDQAVSDSYSLIGCLSYLKVCRWMSK